MGKQAEANECLILLVHALLIAQHTFAFKAQSFMESDRRMVGVNGLATHFVQFQLAECMVKGRGTKLSARAFCCVRPCVEAPICNPTRFHIAELHIANRAALLLHDEQTPRVVLDSPHEPLGVFFQAYFVLREHEAANFGVVAPREDHG